MTTAAEDNNWLIHLKAACDAGYYKAGSDEPFPARPDGAVCRDCFFWLNGYCRLSCREREPEADICAFFIALPTPQATECWGNGATGSPSGKRAQS